MSEFLNSNFFTTLATIIAGLFIFVVYKYQKSREKKDAALVILSEIRDAEVRLDNLIKDPVLKDGIYTEKLLTNNTWSKSKHMFVNSLDRDEIKIIDAFYSTCESIDRNYEKLAPTDQLLQKGIIVQDTLSRIAEKNTQVEDYEKQKRSYLDIIEKEEYLFVPNIFSTSINKMLVGVQYVLTSSAGKKLKKISGLKY